MSAPAPVPPGWRLRVHESLPSTAALVTTLAAAGEPEGLAVLARRQTAGRGTRGRDWASPAGNLHLSVLLRPPGPLREAPRWGLLAAVALAEALEAHGSGPDALALKWPNDVLRGGAKLAGILAECEAGPGGSGPGEGIAWLNLGFGANLAHAPEVPGRATARLADGAPPTPEAVASTLLARLDHWRRVRRLEGFAPVRAAWERRGPAPGTLLTVRRGEGASVSGRFAGLAEDGSLLLATAGRVHAVAAGEVAG